MKLREIQIKKDATRLLELSILIDDKMNEGISDEIASAAHKAGLHIGKSKGLFQIARDAGTHIGKAIYYAIKSKGGDESSKAKLKELLSKKVTKEELIDFFLRLDQVTLHAITGPIHAIDAVMGWHIAADLKEKGKTVEKRIVDALAYLDAASKELPKSLSSRLKSHVNKIKKLIGI